METFITIATFQYPHQAYIIKAKLESEGIYVLLKDELTIQAHNFLSNAIGGVKLQIKLATLYFDKSMIYGFRNPKELSAMAFCQVQLKNYDEAIDCLKEAVEINRDYKIQLASVYEMKEDWENALKYYSEYIDHRESWDINAIKNVEFQKLKEKRDSIKRIIQ